MDNNTGKKALGKQAHTKMSTGCVGILTPLVQQLNCLDLHQISKICIEQIPKLVNARYASLYILDEESDMLHLENRNHPYLINNIVSLNQANLSPMIKAVRNKELIVSENVELLKAPGNHKNPGNYGSPSCIIAPLVCHNKVVGVLNLADKYDGAKFTDEDITTVELFRHLVGASIRNIKLFEKTQTQAKTDGLTGLINHRTFYETLEQEFRRCQRYGGQIAVIMVDIDNLKTINDTYGHRAGDAAIKNIGKKITTCIRKIDTAARYGGDEFAIIFPNTSISEAITAAERMVQEVSQTPMNWQGRKVRLSVSIGVGQYDGDIGPDDATRHSDEALYAAKQAGKNTVRVFELSKSNQ
ncbi:MAG: sensor domain-containing diguanylate cyclase [Phycisphaerae bacterium]|nr:sensor domain-containing diguanylate cyclase [Phycisphaerae bacterium]